MNTTRIIKVFLASSITELKKERFDLADLGNDIRHLFRQDKIVICFDKCENMHFGNIGEDDQKAIDEMLRDCEMSLFLFKTKAGEWTSHEFEVARALQKKKLHWLFVYFINTPDGEKNESLGTFQERLKKENIFWKECDDVRDVKFSFAMGVLNHLKITVSEGFPESKEIAKELDSRFEQYKKNEQQQLELRKYIYKDIEDLLAQKDAILADKNQPIASRIVKVNELYKKASDIAAVTAYDKEKYANLLFGYAQFLYKYGLYKDSEAIYLRQIPLVEELYGKISKEAAASYNDIGIVYKEIGDYKKAINYLSKALNTKEIVFGSEHADTATTYNDIGLVYKYDDNCRKALKYYRRALTIRKRIPTNYIDISESLNNIGALYISQKKYNKALKYLRKAFAIRKKVLDAKDSRISVSYNNIGMVYFKKHNYEKALKYYHATLKIREEILGKEHPLTATSYNNIGEVYREQGDYDNALKYLLRALEIRKKIPSQKYLHPYIAQSYNHIGMVYYAQGNYRKALDNLNEAYCIYEITLDPKHPDTIQTLRDIELVQKAM